MNKVLSSACLVIVIVLSACSEQAEYDSSLPKYPAAAASPAASADSMRLNPLDTLTAPLLKMNQPPLPSIVNPMPSAKSTAAANPVHGAPGHRCDIAVGAPLNLPIQPAQQAAPAIQTLPAQPKVLPLTGGTGKLNPAHGQPGHDCAIPVGQPLKG